MKIFDDILRIDKKPCEYGESDYNFYNRVNNTEYEKFRLLLEEWFSTLPRKFQIELLPKFKNNFKSTFYEIYTYILFGKLGYKIEHNPKTNLRNKTPDFLCTNEKIEFYVEATIVKDKTEKKEKEIVRYNNVYKEIAKIKSPNFLVCITKLELLTKNSIKLKELKLKIETTVSTYNPDDIYVKEKFPTLDYSNKNISISITFFPKKPEYRNNESEVIGFTPAQSRFSTTGHSIGKSLKKKLEKYKELDKPLLVTINYEDCIYYSEKEILDVLYGFENTHSNIEKAKGIFSSSRLSKNLIGVYITSVFPTNIHNCQNKLFLNNNFASNHQMPCFKNLDTISKIEKIIKRQTGLKSYQILNLPENWISNVWDFK